MANPERVNYSSVVVVHNPDKGRFMFNFYDDGYPVPIYRGRANPIGGNREEGDCSPLDTLRRELTEEFSENHLGREILRDMLSNITNYLAFEFVIPQQSGPRKERHFLTSVYSAQVSDELLDIVERRSDEKLVNEGLIKVVTRDDLIRGEILFAWDGGVELAHFLKIEIPNPEGVQLRVVHPIKEKYE